MKKPGLRFLGHRVHPAVVHFPMGLLPLSLVSDLFAIGTKDPFWWRFSFWILALGLISAIPALLSGTLDYLAIPENQGAAVKTANWHLTVLFSSVTVFGLGLFLRFRAPDDMWGNWLLPFSLSFLGTLLLSAGGWLGGELVFRHGIGKVEEE